MALRRQGLAWKWSKIDDRWVVGHGGGDSGATTEIILDPYKGIGVVVLANVDGTDARKESRLKIQRALLEIGDELLQ